MVWPPDRAVAALYPDCPADVAAWAAKRLRRQALTPHREPCPLTGWPAVPSSVVYCEQDYAIAATWLRRIASERFGQTAHPLPGGHSPFLSRPAGLADVLEAVSRQGLGDG
jgi:hypothetical protein